jgi:hypothetical protein
MALLLLFSSAALGEGGQFFLNVYVDDTASGKALVVGNVEDISGLAFLNDSDKIYEDNDQPTFRSKAMLNLIFLN